MRAGSPVTQQGRLTRHACAATSRLAITITPRSLTALRGPCGPSDSVATTARRAIEGSAAQGQCSAKQPTEWTLWDDSRTLDSTSSSGGPLSEALKQWPTELVRAALQDALPDPPRPAAAAK
jgi:hypothetical protein